MNERWVGTAALIVLTIAGCAPRGILVPSGSENLPPCEQVAVTPDELASSGGCNLEGLAVMLPDGGKMLVPEIGGSAGDGRYQVMNIGKMGVLLVDYTRPGTTEFAGTPEAIREYQEEYG